MKEALELRRIKRSLYGTQSVCEMAWSGAISSTVDARRIAFDPAAAIAAEDGEARSAECSAAEVNPYECMKAPTSF